MAYLRSGNIGFYAFSCTPKSRVARKNAFSRDTTIFTETKLLRYKILRPGLKRRRLLNPYRSRKTVWSLSIERAGDGGARYVKQNNKPLQTDGERNNRSVGETCIDAKVLSTSMVVLAAVQIAEKSEFEKQKTRCFPEVSPRTVFTVVFEFKTRYAPTRCKCLGRLVSSERKRHVVQLPNRVLQQVIFFSSCS